MSQDYTGVVVYHATPATERETPMSPSSANDRVRTDTENRAPESVPAACILPDPVRQRALLNAFHRETKSHEELAAMLMTVNASLEQHYQDLRRKQEAEASAEEEARLLEEIQGLEVQRFDLMSRLHGERLDQYGLMPYRTP
ncbi:MAG: hypothetical protein AB7P76_10435 [Candidatus Melainabacteria bacterium]